MIVGSNSFDQICFGFMRMNSHLHMKLNHPLQVAKNLALKASEEILKLLKNSLPHTKKADNSIVTEADLRSDKMIREGLQKEFPHHAILTEETGLAGDKNSEFIWVVDPLDGTKAYANGIAGFSIMIGLLKEGKPYLGVVVDPLEGHLYEAIRGEGAFHTLNGKREKLQVSNRNDFKEMPIVISTGFPKDKLEIIQKKLGGEIIPPINSVGIKVGLIVRQVGDIYINHHPVSYWDTCAPQIILEEAGGKFTKLDGTKPDYELISPFSDKSLTLVSNGKQHGRLIETLKSILI